MLSSVLWRRNKQGMSLKEAGFRPLFCLATILNRGMEMHKIKQPEVLSAAILKNYAGIASNQASRLLDEAYCGFDRKIIVLDDDPTGVQTVHGVSVYTEWSKETIEQGFRGPDSMFFILTNSRSFQREETEHVHRVIGHTIAEVSRATGKRYVIVSRGDSTLRGHYPLETEALRNAVEQVNGMTLDGEILCPFFLEGGRYTLQATHYVREGDWLIPVGDTEFAKDASFGYKSSNLVNWCLEKYKGSLKPEQIICIPLELLQIGDVGAVTRMLMQVSGFGKVIVDAVCYNDIKVFCAGYLAALRQGKEFLLRSAASLPKILGRVPDRPLLSKSDLVAKNCKTGGIILVGSHVEKTTQQLEALKNCQIPIHMIEFDQHRVLQKNGLLLEKQRVVEEANLAIAHGDTVVVYTRRERLDIDSDNPDDQLQISVEISNALTGVIGDLQVRPRFIIAKGGITSSDVGTKALRVKKAIAMGQICPGVPVWMTGEESKFPGMPYIIFPGNVGTADTLREAVEILTKSRGEDEC